MRKKRRKSLPLSQVCFCGSGHPLQAVFAAARPMLPENRRKSFSCTRILGRIFRAVYKPFVNFLPFLVGFGPDVRVLI